jgi:putative ABC transport system ATP-binding protein
MADLPLRRVAVTLATVLSIRGLAKTYGGVKPRAVFAGVSLELEPGDFVAVMGESGSGKSTLLNLIAGLDRADAGTIVIDGIALATLDDDALTRLRGARMGFVFQAFHVLPYLDVARNVGLPLALLEVEPDAARARVAAMLAAVGLAERFASMPRELSGGELQRVAIARALVHGPRLVLADEPTGNLDSDTARGVLQLLREQIKARCAPGILVTHSRAAADTADRILLLGRDGLRTLESG